MSDRERGFIVIQRQIQSSPIWLSLSAEQRSCFDSILLLANWTPGRFMYGTSWVEVGRGELAHSLETIAKHAKVSIKVARTTIAKLIAGQTLGTRQGTAKGTGPRILIVNNYNKHQSTAEEAGTVFGTPKGTDRAQTGHSVGTPRALIEQEQPDQPRKQETPLAPSPVVSPPSVVVLTVPCVGAGAKEVGITQAQIEHWQELFPGIDALAQVRAAVAWCESNPTKRKTERGVPRFITSWLTRAQDGQARTGPVAVQRKVNPTPPPFPALDLAWLEQLPESSRSAARSEWSEAEAAITRAAYPSDLGRLLSEKADSLRSKYDRQEAHA